MKVLNFQERNEFLDEVVKACTIDGDYQPALLDVVFRLTVLKYFTDYDYRSEPQSEWPRIAYESFNFKINKAGCDTSAFWDQYDSLEKAVHEQIDRSHKEWLVLGLCGKLNEIIDTSMTNLKKVTNETESAYSSFLSSASSQARELGASISDVIDSTAEWSRLGYTLDESQELAKWSTVLSNIGDGIDSASDAASYLVSILKGFRMEADEVEHIVNVLNSVGNNEPISESGIAEALVRSASALSAAGNSFEESVSLISAANSVLQDPDTVGTTLKTISMYLRASKTDAEAFGVSVDDMASSVSELRSELKSLTGVDIMKDAAGTEFKSTYQILKEISAVWDKLTDVSKANVTEMLGGKRNSNAVLSVIEQFSIAEKSMEDAANSSNSAMTEQERMMDSIEGRLKQLNASFEKFSNDVMSSDLIKFFVTLATKIVDAADGMVNLAGSIPAITAAISGVLSVMQMSGKLKNGAGKVNMPSYVCCV